MSHNLKERSGEDLDNFIAYENLINNLYSLFLPLIYVFNNNYEVNFDREYIIGRSKKADITVPEDSASREHAKIRVMKSGSSSI